MSMSPLRHRTEGLQGRQLVTRPQEQLASVSKINYLETGRDESCLFLNWINISPASGSESTTRKRKTRPDFGGKPMRIIILLCAALVSFAATLTLSSSNASAVFWRGITAPTNIDVHGWPIINEPPPSP